MRKPDYANKKLKSVVKKAEKYTKQSEKQQNDDGGRTRDLYQKTKKTDPVRKQYRSFNSDSLSQYFAYEIANVLGLETPKVRILNNSVFFTKLPKTKDHQPKFNMVAEEIPNYLPLSAYNTDPTIVHPGTIRKNKNKSKIGNFSFDPKKQVLEPKWPGKKLKITGNLFATYCVSLLLQNRGNYNTDAYLGFLPNGDHVQTYYTLQHDKIEEQNNFEELTRNLTFNEKLLKEGWINGNDEQVLSAIYSIQKLITRDKESKQSPLEKIFYNDKTAGLWEAVMDKVESQRASDVCSHLTSNSTGFKIEELDNEEKWTKLGSIGPGFSKTLGIITQKILAQLETELINPGLKPINPLTSNESIDEYSNLYMETCLKIIKKEFASSSLTLVDLLKEMYFDVAMLENDKEYRVSEFQLLNVRCSFTIRKNMSAEEFFVAYFKAYDRLEKYLWKEALEVHPQRMIDAVVNNANHIINNALKDDQNALKSFAEREAIRLEIIDKVLDKRTNKQGVGQEHFEIVKARMLEDLKAPYYQNLFVKNKVISKNDLNNELLLQTLYKDNYVELEINRDEIRKGLEQYIKRFEPQTATEPINFSQGFKFFVNSQTLNRKANYHLAYRLIKELDAGKNIEAIFDPDNIHDIRQEFFEQEGIVSKMKSLNIIGWGIHSTELKGIISKAQDECERLHDEADALKQKKLTL